MTERPSVLVVDSLEATHEVLRTVFESRGVQVFTADKAEQGLELARRHHPDLVVVDLELAEAGVEETARCFREETASGESPVVFLGTARLPRTGRPDSEFVAKPYHYAVLVRRIEELLRDSGSPAGNAGEGVVSAGVSLAHSA